MIDHAELSPLERKTVEFMMYGYTIKDIADNFGKSRQLYEILLKRAVRKIVKENNREWEECTGGVLDDE